MDRTALAALAAKHKTADALRTALRAHFKTQKGQQALAQAPLYYGTGLPRPMTAEDAVDALLEEAASMPKLKEKS